MVLIHAIAILFFLFMLGLPLSFFCLREKRPGLHLLLAPHCGLALLAIIATNMYLLNIPVSRIVLPVAGLCLLNMVGSISYILKTQKVKGKSLADFIHGINATDRRLLIPVLLFVLAFIIYALPFLLNPHLVFYAYAGSDGYAYMSTAEYQMTHGVYDAPSLDLYHVYSGLIESFTRIKDNSVDKPGSMMALAFFSGLFSNLPHSTFSPLMLCFTMMIFLSAFALASSLRFAPIFAGLAAFLTTTSLPVLALSSNTYFGATLTIAFLPAILVVVQDIWTDWKQGVLFVFFYTAYFLFSPPSFMIPLASCSLYIGYTALHHIRQDVRSVIGKAILWIGFFTLLNLLDFRILLGNLRIFNYVFNPVSIYSRVAMDLFHLKWQWALFWHTLGLGPIMASSASDMGIPSLIVFGLIFCVGLVFLLRSIFRRDFSILFFSYLTFWLAILLGGVGGMFHSFEILSRQAQQFVPLHSLVYLSFFQFEVPMIRKNKLIRLGLTLALLFIMIYPFTYFYQFEKESLVNNPQTINQYFVHSLRARQDIGEIVGLSPVLVSSSVPMYTGLANVAALFSNLRLAIPTAYLKFYFLENVPRPDDYYCTPYVLASASYLDVHNMKGEAILYQANGYRLSRNDLIPFFDNDTFEIKYGIDARLLNRLNYLQARILSGDTNIHLCSLEERRVQITFRYTPLSDEQVYDLVIGPGPAIGRVVFGEEGQITTIAFPLSIGINQIGLKARSSGKIEIFDVSVNIVR